LLPTEFCLQFRKLTQPAAPSNTPAATTSSNPMDNHVFRRMPRYWGCLPLRLLPVFDIILSRALEHGNMDLFTTIITRYEGWVWKSFIEKQLKFYLFIFFFGVFSSCRLWSYHECPADMVLMTLNYYFDSPLFLMRSGGQTGAAPDNLISSLGTRMQLLQLASNWKNIFLKWYQLFIFFFAEYSGIQFSDNWNACKNEFIRLGMQQQEISVQTALLWEKIFNQDMFGKSYFANLLQDIHSGFLPLSTTLIFITNFWFLFYK
jgi:hypothetical protein